MDGVAIALQAPEEAEGEDADGQADERHHDPDASDDGEKQFVDAPLPLHRNTHLQVKTKTQTVRQKTCDID